MESSSEHLEEDLMDELRQADYVDAVYNTLQQQEKNIAIDGERVVNYDKENMTADKLVNRSNVAEPEQVGEVGDISQEVPVTRKGITNNARRCRTYREKKRTQKQKVLDENAALKRERQEMLETLADLEYQAQSLRGQEFVDYSDENDILRREIKKYKEYIEEVVHLNNKGVNTYKEEKQRAIRMSLESAAGQTVGLLYTSNTDSNWKEGKTYPIILSEEAQVETVARFKYQWLPTGSSSDEVKRLNLRFDVLLPLDANLLAELLEETRYEIQAIPPDYDITVDEIMPLQGFGHDMKAKCAKMTATRGACKRQQIWLWSSKYVDLHEHAFPKHSRSSGEVFPQRTKLSVSSSCNLLPLDDDRLADDSAETVVAMSMNATMFRPAGHNMTYCTSVATMPAGYAGLYQIDSTWIREDGSMCESWLNATAVIWKNTYESVRTRMGAHGLG